MANPAAVLQNPIVVEVMDHLDVFLADANVVQEVIDAVRAEIVENAALHVEAAAQLAQACRRLDEALVDAAVRLAPPPEERRRRELDVDDDFPDVIARAAAELADCVGNLVRVRDILAQALAFLVLLRAAAFAAARAPLVPGVLLAAAYAVAYVASGGVVVPGTASLLRIVVLILCFLFGLRG